MNKVTDSRHIGRIRTRFRNNQNWLGLIVGQTGTGKSWAAVKLCEIIDKNFNINNICFDSRELLELIDGGELNKGSMLLYDEAGISFGARDFYQDVNKALSYFFQGFRAFNIGVVFTTPDQSFIDVHARKIIHAVIQTVGLNREEGYCIVKWKNLDHNPVMSKTYYKYDRYRVNKKISKETQTRIHKASDELLEAYETKKMKFLKQLTKDSLERIKYDEQTKKKISDSTIRDIIRKEKVELNAYVLQNKFGIGKDRAYRIIRSLSDGV